MGIDCFWVNILLYLCFSFVWNPFLINILLIHDFLSLYAEAIIFSSLVGMICLAYILLWIYGFSFAFSSLSAFYMNDSIIVIP